MEIYCLERFKSEFEKLMRKKSYSSLEKEIGDYFFGKTAKELASGKRLNNSVETPFIKKRLNGSGGFRLYFLVLIKDNKLYLMFVHPKTGALGAENITNESKAALYKDVLEAIKSNKLFEVNFGDKTRRISFTPAKPKN